MEKKWDDLWVNAMLATCEGSYGLIYNAALAVKHGKIAWLGNMDSLLKIGTADDLAKHVYDVRGFCITPGLIDCHTHLVYAGNRANEFALRLQGLSYAEIARRGGGIFATVNATRNATYDQLFAQSLRRAEQLQKSGVTTLEIKSGYGLDWLNEYKLLQVAKDIGNHLPLTVVRTFLGAHTIPVEYKDNRSAYVDLLCKQMIPKIAHEKLAEAVDVFCETIAFNLEETEKIFKTAKDFGLDIKCHAEQLSDLGVTQLAVEYNALSVDHLEYLEEKGVRALAKSKRTVAVLLPGAFYFLRESKKPPIELLRKYRIPIALASDCNPGTSPVSSIQIALNMACILFNLTPEEALLGVTQYAAQALNIDKNVGTLTVNKCADFAVWEISHPQELAYMLGNNPLKHLVKSGHIVINKHIQ